MGYRLPNELCVGGPLLHSSYFLLKESLHENIRISLALKGGQTLDYRKHFRLGEEPELRHGHGNEHRMYVKEVEQPAS